MDKKYIGNEGEAFAVDILKEKGYLILERNYMCRTGEIDIIARDGDTFVFVEVKTRKNNLYGNPSEFVDFRKQRKIKSAAMYFLKNDGVDMRFDVFEILYKLDGEKFVVTSYNHIENAF